MKLTELNCGSALCVKKTLIVINIFFLLMSIALIALGAYAFTKLQQISHIANTTLPILIITLGSVMFILSFFGCCGAWRERRTCILIYFFLLLGVMIAQLAVGGVTYKYGAKVEGKLSDIWHNDLDDSDRNFLQNEFGCCGFMNSSDAPGSNCNVTHSGEPNSSSSSESPLKELPGCDMKLKDSLNKNIVIVEIIAFVFGGIQAVGLVFSLFLYCCVSCASDKEDEEDMGTRMETGGRRVGKREKAAIAHAAMWNKKRSDRKDSEQLRPLAQYEDGDEDW